jgi:hypothetical protein
MSTDMTPPDCLVLKIEEFDDELCDHIGNIFVLYDQKMEKYVLRGSGISKKMYCSPFSFIADNASDVADFISFAIDVENNKNYILYNYDNLPETSDEITYEFLCHWESQEYEIAGYNGMKPNKKTLVRWLRMLRNIYNQM